MTSTSVPVAVASWREWAPGLRTLTLAAEPFDFTPGQFVNLALDVEGERVSRSYSLSSAPGAPLETFVVEVAGGALTPGLFALAEGDSLWLDPRPQGHFTLERVPEAEVLWLIATGTGLGPYVSMLRAGEALERFAKVVVVHGVREASHLAYRDELAALDLSWIGLVSREDPPAGALGGRITAALQSGALEEAAGVALDERAHALLCGNPGMIRDLRALLEERGLRRNRPRKPGHFTSEKYW
ncbi:MAG TPA: ferredoxin--NADP(+) reductase [Planctomycetes bacterium]|nr:ferredoxin--NADP(+) reductase [Planctomycetota bacterium]